MKKLITIILLLALIVPASAFAVDPDPICGKWSFYWDTRPMNETYNNGKPMMSFLVLSHDLYVYDDNTAYYSMAQIDTSGQFKQYYPAMDGVWTKTDANKYVFVINGKKYEAEIDKDNRLLLYTIQDVPYPFYKITSYDYVTETK